MACHVAKLTGEEEDWLRAELKATCHGLVIMLGLRTTMTPRIVFTRHDVQELIEVVMRDPKDVDWARQFCCIMLVLWYTASRGGSIFVTDSYTNYLRIEDVEIYRAVLTPREHGVTKVTTFGFHLRLRLSTFKGYQNGQRRLVVTYRIDTVSGPRNLDFDLGLMLVVCLFRRGAFGKRSLEDIWNGEGLQVRVEDEFLKQPLFLAGTPGGRGLVDPKDPRVRDNGALTLNGFTKALRKYFEDEKYLGREVGERKLGGYAFRMGATTTMRKIGELDDGSIQHILGHRHGTRTMRQTYDLSMNTTNVVGALMEGETLNVEAPDITEAWLEGGPRPPREARAPRHKVRPLREIVKSDPVLLEMAISIVVLERSLKNKSREWMELEEFSDRSRWGSNDLELAISMTRYAFKKRVKYWQDGDWLASREKLQEQRDLLTAEEVQRRIAEAGTKNYVAVDESLQKRHDEMQKRGKAAAIDAIEAARGVVLSAQDMGDVDENSRVELIVITDPEEEEDDPYSSLNVTGREEDLPDLNAGDDEEIVAEKVSELVRADLFSDDVKEYYASEFDKDALIAKLQKYAPGQRLNLPATE
ncbi:hypothetical protein NCC49_000688 [Naganishia albida]|nr:hypothetical protein NCC49_000688 [Naganishia albida]